MAKPIPYNRPLPTILSTPTVPTFTTRLNQMVRIMFQLSGNVFASQAAMKEKANWDALIASTGTDKVIFTSLFSNTKVSQSKALETGSDTNMTYRGISEYFGEGVSKVTLDFRGKDAASMNSMSDITQFSLMNAAGLSSLTGYFVNNDGHIFSNGDWSGFRIWNFALRTRGSEGLNSNDVIGASFELEPNWDSTFIPTIPNFDPRLYQ